MLKFLVLSLCLVAAWAQEEGVCQCGLYAQIQESGILPPNSRIVGPLYILQNTDTTPYPCTGNVEAICAQYCDQQISDWLAAGNDLDTPIEIEVAPGVYENSTIGQVMCTRSYQLHPNPPGYDGTLPDGTPTRMHMQLNPCENWTYRGCYAEMPLCCTRDYEYYQCPGPVACS